MRVPTRKDRDPNYRPEDENEDLDAFLPEAEEDEEERAPEGPLPMVAIVGRPNVGKSTLFNRIIGRRKAVVLDTPGVTRDRNIARAEWDGLPFLCVDTGGYDVAVEDPLIENVMEQVKVALEEADAIIILAACGEDAHPADEMVINMLRGSDKPVFLAVNKCDSPKLELQSNDFYRYGYDKVYPVAALHGVGVADLLSDVLNALRNLSRPPSHEHLTGGIALAIVGRQNVGKSTLVNRLCGEERVIASDVPGTTRDAIDTVIQTPEGKIFNLIDTAGIRRRGKIERGVEKISVLTSMLSLERADVAAVVIDASRGITEQDAHIAGYAIDAGLATMILVNKWDLVDKDHRTADLFTRKLEEEWAFLRYAPVLYISAQSGQRTHRILEIAERIHANSRRRIPTHELNARLEEWVGKKPPTMARNRRPKVRFMTQTGVQPPTFTMFVNDPTLFHFSYKRYIMNRLREAYDFEGTPIKLQLRQNKTKAGDIEIKEPE